MNTEQTTPITPSVVLAQAAVATPPAATVAPTTPHFEPPRLTKMGKIATLTQDGGLGGSLTFP